ncbi:ATP-grasp domain-containing protein [Allobacillus sp. GCM10007491]|uniref:ATP-grasp domain-containing protein n=1 Tax=Allobacillus saliphilus TaxID=2912308 RepID=A0A941CW80_9BACI|nr:ATP-grasp domain-containing protein [Allobacillus saliphilus]MBR7553711.1 ATP-grasp domain-containing protein [Allobacillus saliphilus]
MNILICSTGSRVKMTQYIKEAVKSTGGKVIAGDSDPYSPALFAADDYVLLKPVDDDEYISSIIQVCKQKEIDAIIPLIEEEVPKLVKNQSVLDNIGVKLATSEQDLVDVCTDKLKTYQYIDQLGFPGVPTFSTIEETLTLLNDRDFDYPLIVKPADGKGSEGVWRVENETQLREAVEKVGHPIIQPYLKDKEFGIDVYIDLINGQLVDVFMKEKFKMVNGATDKSISVNDEKLLSLITSFVEAAGFTGPLDIDCFEWNGKYYISEINPRFGAGYLHAHEMGCNFMKYIVNNLIGKENQPFERIQYPEGIWMMKYSEVMLRKIDSSE